LKPKAAKSLGTQTPESEKLLRSLKEFAENLELVTSQQVDNLYFFTLMSVMETVGAARASVLNYIPDKKVLYSIKTMISDSGGRNILHKDNEVKSVAVSALSAGRAHALKNPELIHTPDAGLLEGYDMAMDTACGIKPGSVIHFPVWYDNTLKLLIEFSRVNSEPVFSANEQLCLQILLRFTSALLNRIHLYEWAIRDSLTGCYGISYFSHRVDELIAENRRNAKSKFCLIMIDIDKFKTINDTYGHAAGDNAIIHFTECIHSVLRETDILGRYGGDEFCLLLKNADVEESEKLLTRIYSKLRTSPLNITDDIQIHLSASMGIAQFPIHGEDTETLFKAADKALYAAKESGRGKWMITSGV